MAQSSQNLKLASTHRSATTKRSLNTGTSDLNKSKPEKSRREELDQSHQKVGRSHLHLSADAESRPLLMSVKTAEPMHASNADPRELAATEGNNAKTMEFENQGKRTMPTQSCRK